MLQKGIQLLNFSQNKKQSTYDTVKNYDNLKIITCAKNKLAHIPATLP
jgi:Leucine-rich repeat (LRR) protein